MPDFIIIGAQKAGTSSLHYYLSQHPQVIASSVKEVHYFDNHFEEGLLWYKAHFPLRSRVRRRERELGKPVLVGEASPYYLFHPHAPRRIREALPEAKLIAFLRDPVKRAYSHYQMGVRRNKESLSFEEAVERERERLPGETVKMLADEHYRSEFHQVYSYVERGIYVDQLEVYAELFGRDQLLVMPSEALFADTQATVDAVTDFLGLERAPLTDVEPKWVGTYKKKAALPLEDELRAFYAPHNQRLYEFLGRTFDW
ncbi:MAG: sulfotransferase [Bacteroidota bacterium]